MLGHPPDAAGRWHGVGTAVTGTVAGAVAVALTVAAATAATATVSVAQTAPAIGPATPISPIHGAATSYLWALSGTAGTIERRSGGDLVLRLHGVPRYVTKFADRPIRQALSVSRRTLVRQWDILFAGDPPNAVLTYLPVGRNRQESVVLTLRSPRLTEDGLRFRATRIHRALQPSPIGGPPAPPAPVTTPARFDSPSLFIDSSTETDDRLLGEVFVMATARVPDQDAAADGASVQTSLNEGLFSMLYAGTRPVAATFPLPAITATWPAVTATSGAARPVGWVVGSTGIWDTSGVPQTLLPGQVFFTSALAYDPTASGGVETTLSGTLPAGMRAFTFPAVTSQAQASQYYSELRLLDASAPVPSGWLPADGSLVDVAGNSPLFSLLGTAYGGDGTSTFAVPNAAAPAGYRWVIANSGSYPSS